MTGDQIKTVEHLLTSSYFLSFFILLTVFVKQFILQPTSDVTTTSFSKARGALMISFKFLLFFPVFLSQMARFH